MTHPPIRSAAAGVTTAILLATAPVVLGQRTGSEPKWVTAWGTSQQAVGDTAITNATVRMIARVAIPGERIRIRLDNAYNTTPVTIGRAAVGYRVQGAAVAAGSSRAVTFSGSPSVSIPPNGSVWSDPIALWVLAQQDLAVSFFIPGADVKPSQHNGAVVTSYRTADGSGDLVTTEPRASFTGTTTAMWWLKAIDVESDASGNAVVAFGDSITDGTCSTLDAHDRWEDVVSARLFERTASNRPASSPREDPLAIVNEGIGGNTLTRQGLDPPPDSPPALERIERDVLSHHGVSTVVLFMGTNDIRRGAS